MIDNWPFLTSTFGLTPANVIQGTTWQVTNLREGGSEATLIVAAPRGTIVYFGWPDGMVSGTVEPKGDIGFGMGGGAYYYPPNQGPHWVSAGDAKVTGLGMLGGTEHRHINVTFARGTPVPPPPPVPPPTPPPGWVERVRGLIEQAQALLDDALDLLP